MELSSLVLLGATAELVNCAGCAATDLLLAFPTYDREVRESNNPPGRSVATLFGGEHVVLRNITLTQSNNKGLSLAGNNITLDNCLISYTDWLGTLSYPPLGVHGNQIEVTRCTVRDFGNAGVVTSIPNTLPAAPGKPQMPAQPMGDRRLVVAHSHIFNGGRVGEDTAALYGGGWAAAGQVWHHNWVHDTTEKCLRFDDQSENATIHHNVVYNCGMPQSDPSSAANSGVGIVAKGDGHVIYANTVFHANHSELCLASCVEKPKPYRSQYPLVLQNAHTQVFNTAAKQSTGFCGCSPSAAAGGNRTAIFTGADLGLVDAPNHDYRPAAGSPLVDAGVVIPPYTAGYVGRAPDIGAYERGGEVWTAGCTGLQGC